MHKLCSQYDHAVTAKGHRRKCNRLNHAMNNHQVYCGNLQQCGTSHADKVFHVQSELGTQRCCLMVMQASSRQAWMLQTKSSSTDWQISRPSTLIYSSQFVFMQGISDALGGNADKSAHLQEKDCEHMCLHQQQTVRINSATN